MEVKEKLPLFLSLKLFFTEHSNPDTGQIIKILLAEDDLDDQELLSEAFLSIDPNIHFLSFTTGKKIISYLEGLSDNDIPDMVILDYNIPEMNGEEILKYLQKHTKYNSIIKLIWSTSNSVLYEDACMAIGAYAYLVKPSNISGLDELAKKILGFIQK